MDASGVDPATFDLSVKNPNGSRALSLRHPPEIIDGIAELDLESAELQESTSVLIGKYLATVGSIKRIGWIERPICEIAEHSLGKMLDRAKNKGELKPYLRNQNVRWFEFDMDDLLEMRFTPGESDKYTARRGDVLVCEGGYPGAASRQVV